METKKFLKNNRNCLNFHIFSPKNHDEFTHTH